MSVNGEEIQKSLSGWVYWTRSSTENNHWNLHFQILFELARFHAPSTIFIDELESVMSIRGSGQGGEHEGSRRMKTELLIQMDGLAKSDDLVFLLAASNLPWFVVLII